MKTNFLFSSLSRGEKLLWLSSCAMILGSALLAGGSGPACVFASLIGVTALIFVAKGYVAGQILTVVFALVYGVISFFYRYYGEMITYLGMTAPIALLTAVTWLRHPFEGSREVEICRVNRVQIKRMLLCALPVTAAFFLILRALGNASLTISTISIATSFFAAWLSFLRSPYYALAYAANDLVLIVLWSLASAEDLSCLSMVICFAMFLLNDLYGFVNWQRMLQRQMLMQSFPEQQQSNNLI